MAHASVICPVCGAKIPDIRSPQDFICSFCDFERRPATELTIKPDTCLDNNLWDMTLPFLDNINDHLHAKFLQLSPGDTLYLSVPVKRPFQKLTPLPGQINFFKAKNIMFLLEQHGFKMIWRQNRFSSTLRIIARKC